MGGFVAAVPRGAPASPELIERVVAASQDRSPDGVRHVVTPEGVLLVQCMFANTPESVGELLPKCDPSGRVWIVKRGHLNNIDELRGRLRDRLGSDAVVHTDADVMLAAYLAWGTDMAGQINGEFTLAIWDGRSHSLFVLRDHLGLRGCYTHDGPEWYVAASEPSQVLLFPGVSAELDEIAVADYISGWMVDRVRTFYEGIGRPMPATSTTVAGCAVSERMYWMPSQSLEKATKPASYYAPAVLEAFEQAVRSALRSPTIVACDLSGGLDSAAVLGMCALLAGQDPGSVPEIVAQSLVYPGEGCDETPYIDAVLDRWPVRSVRFDDLKRDELSDHERLARSIDHPIGSRTAGIRARDDWMTEQGMRVRLDGDGGDEVFRSAPLPIAAGLRPRGEVWPYIWWSSARSPRMFARRMRREVVRPRVPSAVVNTYLKARLFRPIEGGLLTARGERMRSRVTLPSSVVVAPLSSVADEQWYPGSLFGAGLNDAVELRSGYELRSPLRDVRLLELVLRMPLLTHRWNGVWRAVQKEAFRTLYPPLVSDRLDKAEFTRAGVIARLPLELAGDELVARGLVDGPSLATRLATINQAAGDGSEIPFPWEFFAIQTIEDWREPTRRNAAVRRRGTE